MTTRLLTFSQIFVAFIALFATGCGPEELYDAESQEFDVSLRVQAGDDGCETTLTGEDADGDASEGEPQEVTAIVCVGGVCVVMTGTLNGNTLTITLPNDPSLIGLPVTATVPGVGTFTGTVTAGGQCADGEAAADDF